MTPSRAGDRTLGDKHSPLAYEYHMNNQTIPRVTSHDYLWVTINQDLSWNKQCDKVCSKASHKLGLSSAPYILYNPNSGGESIRSDGETDLGICFSSVVTTYPDQDKENWTGSEVCGSWPQEDKPVGRSSHNLQPNATQSRDKVYMTIGCTGMIYKILFFVRMILAWNYPPEGAICAATMAAFQRMAYPVLCSLW